MADDPADAGVTARDAFVAGYAPSAASPYFSSLALLGEAARGADEALLHRIGEVSDRIVLLADAARANVARAEAAMARLGVRRRPPPPTDADSYGDWVEAAFAAVTDALTPGSPEAVAHLLGHVLGEGMATLDAVAVLAELQDVAADHLLMRVQAQSLEQERATAERRLTKLAAHPLLPAAVQALAATAASRAAAGAVPGPLAGVAAEVEAAL